MYICHWSKTLKPYPLRKRISDTHAYQSRPVITGECLLVVNSAGICQESLSCESKNPSPEEKLYTI